MILRFSSGSATPSSASKKRSAAFTRITLICMCSANVSMTWSPSLWRSKPMVDEHAGQLVADGLVQQRRDHRRIDAARQPQQHLAVADLLTDLLDRVRDDVARRPVARQPQMSRTKRLQDLHALQRMRHFGMKLHAVEIAVRRPPSRPAANSALEAVATNPGGSASTRSPWLIQTLSIAWLASSLQAVRAGGHSVGSISA